MSKETAPPCTLVIFGASGDLAKRKLIPAIYQLHQEKRLPQGFSVLGTARTAGNDEKFRNDMEEAVRESAGSLGDSEWQNFRPLLHYIQLDMDSPDGFKPLEAKLAAQEKVGNEAGNRIYYFSVPPSAVTTLAARLHKDGLAREDGNNFRRIVIEKPFGKNLQTARELNRQMHEYFDEHQIYRIDHYLGKETVQNILVFRFANGIFEPLWNRQYIDSVQMTVAESIGVDGRGKYYEESGALRDIIQNHVMQLLAIVAMEAPSSFDANSVRDEKVKLLRAVRPIHPDDALSHTVRGQYARGTVEGEQVKSYREEEGVNPESLRETFVAMKVDIDNWRWAGTPFYLRTGKRMARRDTEITIRFRRVPHSPFSGIRAIPSGELPLNAIDPNLLVLHIQPDEGISLQFAAKVPGQAMKIRSVDMDFLYRESFGGHTPDAYERLLLDCMNGDATLFAREDEVEEAWRFCTAILDGWRAHPPDRTNCPNYEAGSWGPSEAHDFIRRDGREWYPH